MPTTFDPVLAGPLHRQQQVLRARLELVFPPARFAHEMVPAKLSPSIWATLVRRKPFVGLGFTGFTPRQESGRVLDGEAIWDLFMVVSNLRPAERMLGDAQGPGGFGMAGVAVLALHGMTIGGEEPAAAGGTVRVTGITNGFFEGDADDQSALIRIGLAVGLQWRQPLDLDDFLRTRVVWDFPVTAAATDDNNVRGA
jgi:hypothetical protein